MTLLVEQITPPDLVDLAGLLGQEALMLLESGHCQHPLARYSFLACDPFQIILIDEKSLEDPFHLLEVALANYSLPRYPELPPFQGGIAGVFSYELGGRLERISSSIQKNPFPELLVGLYDLVLAVDHHTQTAFIMSSGFPEKENLRREKRAFKRLKWLKNLAESVSKRTRQLLPSLSEDALTSNFSQVAYELAVKKVQDYIVAGDIFEANISQCFSVTYPKEISYFTLYCALREKNPAPFAGFFQYGEYALVSSSPERFLQLQAGNVETCPIKGTAPRSPDPAEDAKLAQALLLSEKDRAENIMIVDLMRNDLSKVCLPNSINVQKLCGLESFASVHHLVSRVEGKLSPAKNALDLFKATFPGGSITGAPKIRAQEIIAELEPTCRGPYCGSLGYMGFNGDMDLSILIRSFVCYQNKVTFQVGGAITFDSLPSAEYAETLNKGKLLRETLFSFEYT